MAKINDLKRIAFNDSFQAPQSVPTEQRANPKPGWWQKVPKPSLGRGHSKKIWVIVAATILVPILLIAFPLLSIRVSANKLIKSAKELQAAAASQNISQTKVSLEKTKKDLKGLDGDLNKIFWVKLIPFLGDYWKDAKHLTVGGNAGLEAGEIIVQTVEPYSDILGLNGAQAQDGAENAEDRINFVVETIDDIIPKMGDISAKTAIMSQELSKINPERYPEYFGGKPLRSKLKATILEAQRGHQLLTDGKPVLEQLPYLLGINGEKTYLFLWQNDKELRPTGGFITAYSIIKVKDGKFEQVVSDDIYVLDNKFRSKLPAPEPIKKYLPLVNNWFLRDMNLSPDFKTSMNTFYENYETIKGVKEVDGIISVDTHPLVGLLSVMGTLGIPGYGNYSADEDKRCNCPNVIYELETYADVAGPIVWDDISGKIVYKPPHADHRKGFLGPLMNTLIANALGQPKEKIPGLFDVAWNSLMEKHIMFYMHDNKVQSALESFNLAGRIREYDGDYLHINDSNFAGAKSNLYVQHEFELEVKQTKEGTENTLTLKYKNPQKYDGWLNGPFRDWFRVYVPKGSMIVDSTGSEVPITASEDLGKTVFEGFFILRPEGVTDIKITYKTPIKLGKDGYKLLIQKQPGTAGHLVTIKSDKKKEEFKLTTDKEIRL
ncbi:MAG: DUF4012 domain-containing protein [Patescibacteria group bacterium]